LFKTIGLYIISISLGRMYISFFDWSYGLCRWRHMGQVI